MKEPFGDGLYYAELVSLARATDAVVEEYGQEVATLYWPATDERYVIAGGDCPLAWSAPSMAVGALMAEGIVGCRDSGNGHLDFVMSSFEGSQEVHWQDLIDSCQAPKQA